MSYRADYAYDLEPTIDVAGWKAEAADRAADVVGMLASATAGLTLVAVECYPGVSDEALDLVRQAFAPDVVVRLEDAFLEGDALTDRMRAHLTDDRCGASCTSAPWRTSSTRRPTRPCVRGWPRHM